MTKFNPEGKANLTYGDIMRPAMGITEQDDADQYFKEYVAYINSVRKPDSKWDAEEVAKHNLGYYAGYYSHEIRLRVERLFKCTHPIFGDATKGEPTTAEAFQAGMDLAKGKK